MSTLVGEFSFIWFLLAVSEVAEFADDLETLLFPLSFDDRVTITETGLLVAEPDEDTGGIGAGLFFLVRITGLGLSGRGLKVN